MATRANLDLVTPAVIAKAAQMDDPDDACFFLQEIVKVRQRRVAGVVFSDLDFDWTTATTQERIDRLEQCLATERLLTG